MSPADLITELSAANLRRARNIIRDTGLISIWESVGATVNQVGSVKTELLMKHRDIDFHIYSSPLDIGKSFEAMARLAEHPAITKIEYTNLINTDECCLEWHAWYLDEQGESWQIDMIHLLKGSRYDGYMEHVAERILQVLTPETKRAILEIKYNTPDDKKIPGIYYYQAVLRDGIRTYDQFEKWLENNPLGGVVEWIP